MLLILVDVLVKVGCWSSHFHHATYSGGSTCKSGFVFKDRHSYRYRVIIMLLIQVEVYVKVGCWSTDTASRHRTIIMLLIMVAVHVKVGF